MNQVFIDLGGDPRFSQNSGSFQVGFSWKSDEKTYIIFHSSACSFQHGNPHDSMYFTYRKLLLHFLPFCFLVQKKHVKTRWQEDPQKASTNYCRRAQNGPNMDPKSICVCQKCARRDPNINKMASQNSFLVGQILSCNLGQKRTRKERRGHARHGPVTPTLPSPTARVPTTVFQEQMYPHTPLSPRTEGWVDII